MTNFLSISQVHALIDAAIAADLLTSAGEWDQISRADIARLVEDTATEDVAISDTIMAGSTTIGHRVLPFLLTGIE